MRWSRRSGPRIRPASRCTRSSPRCCCRAGARCSSPADWCTRRGDVITAGIDAARPAGCELPRYNCLGHLALIQVLHGPAAGRHRDCRPRAWLRCAGRSSVSPPGRRRWRWRSRGSGWSTTTWTRRATTRGGPSGRPDCRSTRVRGPSWHWSRPGLLRADHRPEPARDVVRRAGADLALAPVAARPDALRGGGTRPGRRAGRRGGAAAGAAQRAGRAGHLADPGPGRTGRRAGPRRPTGPERRSWRPPRRCTSRSRAGCWRRPGCWPQQEPQRAQAALAHSLRLAEPETLRRPFVEAPPPVRDLLQQNRALVAEHPWMRVRPVDGAPTAAAAPTGQEPASGSIRRCSSRC